MANKNFLITSPLFYTNSAPHLGHLYSILYADFLHRYKKIRGFNSVFVAGLDQHGQKIFNAAKTAGIDPATFVVQEGKKFLTLWEKTNISYTHFTSTASESHKKFVQETFFALKEKKHISLGAYQGFYCIGCESFQSNKEQCDICAGKVNFLEEKNYFFLFPLKDQLYIKKLIEKWTKKDTSNFKYLNQLKDFWTNEKLDLSISRFGLDWGIPLDENQKAYVWFDALLGYLSPFSTENRKLLWKNNDTEIVQVIGKEIMKFHIIYWPMFLKKLGYRVPSNFLVHGWILMGDEKMSKSKKNTIDPFQLLEKFSSDVVRAYLASLMNFNKDIKISIKSIESFYDEFIVNSLSNLHYRLLTMCEKYTKNIVWNNNNFLWESEISELISNYHTFFEAFEIKEAFDVLTKVIDFANQKIEQSAPWALFSDNKIDELSNNLNSLIQVLKIIADLISPFMPITSEKIYKDLQMNDPKNFIYKTNAKLLPIEKTNILFLRNKKTYKDLVDEVLFSAAEIEAGIKKLAIKLNEKFKNKNVVLIGILKGCLPFMMELIKHLDFEPSWDFMIVSSYFGGISQKQGQPKLILDSDLNLEDKYVIIIDDIIDTGKTSKLVKDIITTRGAKKTYIMALGNKQIKKEKKLIEPDWYVFDIPIKFIVGYGLDYREKLRDLKYIATLKI